MSSRRCWRPTTATIAASPRWPSRRSEIYRDAKGSFCYLFPCDAGFWTLAISFPQVQIRPGAPRPRGATRGADRPQARPAGATGRCRSRQPLARRGRPDQLLPRALRPRLGARRRRRLPPRPDHRARHRRRAPLGRTPHRRAGPGPTRHRQRHRRPRRLPGRARRASSAPSTTSPSSARPPASPPPTGPPRSPAPSATPPTSAPTSASWRPPPHPTPSTPPRPFAQQSTRSVTGTREERFERRVRGEEGDAQRARERHGDGAMLIRLAHSSLRSFALRSSSLSARSLPSALSAF